MIYAFIDNAQHPEFGSARIPFPIPSGDYESILSLMKERGIGDALKQDCCVKEITGEYPVLKRLEGSFINLDEMDYLAKRLDSFNTREAAQFQGMAEKMGLCRPADLINLTFCCQQATVITDFSDLGAVGRAHYMNLHDGCATMEELEALDGYETALLLIDSEAGAVTPYGVVYDNGMRLEQLYDGRHFPAYLYEETLLELCVTPRTDPDPEHPTVDYIYLPAPNSVIERTLLRTGIGSPDEFNIFAVYTGLPKPVMDVLNISRQDVYELNNMCHAIRELGSGQMDKLTAAVLLAKPESAFEVGEIAKNLDLFDFVPGAKDAEEYGKYMIQQSGHFEYDPNLDNFYNYSQYGWDRINREQGQFNELGYIAYKGTMTMEELLCGDPVERLEQQIDGMGGMA